ncbi:hypothetical protein K7R09_24165 [Serratia ureilytica]|uniref:Ig-like domain repeat protein n=1 Tax=Serratia ureilytica TaxID=300181 RepID=A0ABU0VQZ4_9GAMM|nr:hypothetical protein [Serratia ureilytica]MCU7064900.1 hypothetical protein [Serratia ureilytica]MDQ1811420.1 hypothetical protein [Serratia ureilytica]MDQ1840377.1 hypothetical protein [Serratia ureilytica]MDQ1863863.1 hypothetical protein [Serratia ureilytica]
MTNSIKYSDVQNAFKEGATPNEDDYQKLITLARVGGLALGATDAAPTTLSPGVGLEIKDNKLAVKAAEKQGLSVSANGVGVEADMTSVAVTGDGLEVMLKKDGGLSKEGGLHVVAGPGLKTDDKGLQIALAKNSGLATAGGLAVAADGKAGLEINKENKLAVRLSQKNKFLEAKDDGLAINDDGIKSIRDTLKAVSIEALNQAVVGTDHGAMKDTHKPEEGSVEARIATALNEAYNAGHAAMEGTLVRPTVKTQNISVPVDGKTVELSKYITPMEGESVVYYIPGADGDTQFKTLGTLDYNKGTLTLTGNTAGMVTVLAFQAHKKAGAISAAAELTVTVTKVEPPYKINSPTIGFIPTDGLELGTLELFDKNQECPTGNLTYVLNTDKTVASVQLKDGKKLVPVEPYHAGDVSLTVTTPPTAKYGEKKFIVDAKVNELQNPLAYIAQMFGNTIRATPTLIENGKSLELVFAVPDTVTSNLPTNDVVNDPIYWIEHSFQFASPDGHKVTINQPGLIQAPVTGVYAERNGERIGIDIINIWKEIDSYFYIDYRATSKCTGKGWKIVFNSPVTISQGKYQFGTDTVPVDIKLKFG